MGNRTAIITGASQGIGAGIARAYLQAGFNVVANSRQIASSPELPATDGLLLVQGDISDLAIGETLVKATIERFGSLDSLVNNAGQFSAKPFTAYTDDEDEALSSVNIHGFLHVARAVVRSMVDQNIRGT